MILGVRTPFIAFLGMPTEEMDAARLLFNALCSLAVEVSKFEDALELTQYCDWMREDAREAMLQGGMDDDAASTANSAFIAWKKLAARDAVVTVNAFHETKQAIHGLYGQCKSLKGSLDKDAQAEANQIFERAFPGFAKARFSVAHAGKKIRHPKEAKKHHFPGTNLTISHFHMGDQFTSTVDGVLVSVSLSRASLDALTQTTLAMYRAFKPVADRSSQIGLQRAQKVAPQHGREKAQPQ